MARICTKLCTYNYHLAMGLVTSNILADQVLASVDRRIAAVCEDAGLQYSRFVDDVTISGEFDFEQSGIPASLTNIMQEHGFRLHPEKWEFGDVESLTITGVSLRDGRFDVAEEYAASIEAQIEHLHSLQAGKPIECPFTTQSQLEGRINYIRWINRDRGQMLRNKVRSLHWGKIKFYAEKHGVISTEKKLLPKDKA